MKKITKPAQAIVFGTDSHANKVAKEKNIPRENIILATHPMDVEDRVNGPVIVVRVPEEKWTPSTDPDKWRVKDTEVFVKEHKKNHEVREERLD